MASEQTPPRKTVDTVGSVIGLLVFLGGIAMIVFVFTLVQGVFEGVDDQMAQVRMASAQASAAAAEAADSGSITAQPGGGPTFVDVGITIALKMLGLLVLGWLGALVASKGAHLSGSYNGKKE